MTFRAPRTFVQPPPVGHPRGDSGLAPTLIMEITTPDGNARVPTLSGWALRAWPVARLGDATLQAQALAAHLDPGDLREALSREGCRVLGPIRVRRNSSADAGRAHGGRPRPLS